MKNLNIHFILFAVLIITVSTGLFAESVNTAFTYQGRLLDAGDSANGPYDLQFKLYDDPNVLVGSQVGLTVTADDVEVVDGYFAAELDFGEVVYGTDARWLQVAARPGASIDPNDFIPLSPLQKMTAAPYANSAYEVTGRVRTAGIYEELINDDYDTWTAKESNRAWRSVAMSANGQYQTAVVYNGRIYVSTDTGNTWTPKGPSRNWRSVAMSADGKYQTAVVWGGQIYVSTDTGNTWTPKESHIAWISVAMSADGQYQTAVANNGQIYVSTDTGNTWTPKESSIAWHSVAMSADGQYQTAVVWGGQIYVSTDTGNTWTPKQSNRAWWSVAMSADGQYQTAVVDNGQIYVSTNDPNTWTPKEPNRAWRSVAMSADGSIQTAVANNGQIYVSTDTGNTWTPKESNRDWRSIAMSADGQYQTAVAYNGRIYVSTPSVPVVGIGTNSPSRRKLTVKGNILVQSETTGEDVVEIGEGLDYAEGFDVTDRHAVEPGTVLIIDPECPGKLTLSSSAYDSRVAGIAAGGKGLGSGVRLGVDRFDCDVALAGRVYCNVDATESAVQPGDLLTTSDTPGHAMKVADFNRARGAILGKAMEKLEKGKKGQILVLVSLQ